MTSQYTHYRTSVTTLGLLLLLLLTGCAGSVKNMREIPAAEAHYAPAPGMALIVFMRPSTLGFAIQSSVFDITADTPQLVGIVAAKKKVAYQLSPGKHTFMVVGESADFMSAEVAAGKSYYALVTPRMGAWKSRFSLVPVDKAQLETPEFQQWATSCNWVEVTPESHQWAEANMPDIQSKMTRYMEKWLSKPESKRPALLSSDSL